MSIRKQLSGGRGPARSLLNLARSNTPQARERRRAVEAASATAMAAIDDTRRRLQRSPGLVSSVLYDGMWENPNYWVRMSLVRAALCAPDCSELAVVGQWQRRQASRNLAALGIDRVIDFERQAQTQATHIGHAKELIAGTRTPADLFDWELPFGFPGMLVFDGILKRQRQPTIQLDDPQLVNIVGDAIASIEAADAIVEDAAIELAVLSHALDYKYGAFAWAAIRRNVPVLVLYGDFGTARFIRMDRPDDLFAYPGRPSPHEMDVMAEPAKRSLADAGAHYIAQRLAGATDDISAVYAFHKRTDIVDRQTILERYGWAPEKPILAIYGANWFDYPHVTGLTEYRDFLDWAQTTLEVAATRTDVNWLVKAHPVDDWYGIAEGTSLEDLARRLQKSHVQSCDRSWNGAQLLRSIDGIICCHSTAGLEAGALGKPVLVAHKGWYGEAGFTVTVTTKANYCDTLRRDWWRDWDSDHCIERANLFAGWYFAVPEWHGDYGYQDDSEQTPIYARIPAFLADLQDQTAREVDEIRDWFIAGHKFYHMFKMSRATRFQSVRRHAVGAQ